MSWGGQVQGMKSEPRLQWARRERRNRRLSGDVPLAQLARELEEGIRFFWNSPRRPHRGRREAMR